MWWRSLFLSLTFIIFINSSKRPQANNIRNKPILHVKMDRCRCTEYAAAVENLRFYTVGTFRPDIIDNYDRSHFITTWVKHGVDYEDMKFSKPKAARRLTPEELQQMKLRLEKNKIERMWCPYMTPVIRE